MTYCTGADLSARLLSHGCLSKSVLRRTLIGNKSRCNSGRQPKQNSVRKVQT